MSYDAEKLQANWETFSKLCGRLSDDGINKLLETLDERLVLCPASP